MSSEEGEAEARAGEGLYAYVEEGGGEREGDEEAKGTEAGPGEEGVDGEGERAEEEVREG